MGKISRYIQAVKKGRKPFDWDEWFEHYNALWAQIDETADWHWFRLRTLKNRLQKLLDILP